PQYAGCRAGDVLVCAVDVRGADAAQPVQPAVGRSGIQNVECALDADQSELDKVQEGRGQAKLLPPGAETSRGAAGSRGRRSKYERSPEQRYGSDERRRDRRWAAGASGRASAAG